jgi:hypothetical protein
MKFEVNKFLALTALLAGGATVVVACSSSDTKTPVATGGEGGSAGTSTTTAGSGGRASAGESAGGASEGGATESGAGAPTSMGGATEGGEGGVGNEACIADMLGEGGAAAEGTTPCDVWGGVDAPDCGQEFGNFASQLCNDLLFEVRPAVLNAFNTCVTRLGDVCDQIGVQGCADTLVGRGCPQDGTAAACTFINSKCTVDASIDNCPALLDITTADAQASAMDCMDPTGATFDTTFDGNCEGRLVACLHLKL